MSEKIGFRANVTEMRPGDQITVITTSGSRYKLTVMDPANCRVAVHSPSGNRFSQPTECFLKSPEDGNIVVDHGMCIVPIVEGMPSSPKDLPGETICVRTSQVKEVYIAFVKLPPALN